MLKVSWIDPERSDEELLKKYLSSGELDILGELYNRYMHLVYGVCLKYLSNRDDAQDEVMQIFERLITELPNHAVRNFKSWLYVLTKNHCLMVLRARQSKEKRLLSYKIEQEFMESEDEMHPIDKTPASPEKALKDCIEQLKQEQKECIELFYFQKLCYQEIASKLGLDEKKVKSYLQNGKRNLKICLEKTHVGQKET